MQSIADDTDFVKEPSDSHFRRGVLTLYPAHRDPSLLRGQVVEHGASFSANSNQQALIVLVSRNNLVVFLDEPLQRESAL